MSSAPLGAEMLTVLFHSSNAIAPLLPLLGETIATG